MTKSAVSVLDKGKNIIATRTNIQMCCHGRQHTAYGYRWIFAPDDDSDWDEFDDKE